MDEDRGARHRQGDGSQVAQAPPAAGARRTRLAATAALRGARRAATATEGRTGAVTRLVTRPVTRQPRGRRLLGRLTPENCMATGQRDTAAAVTAGVRDFAFMNMPYVTTAG